MSEGITPGTHPTMFRTTWFPLDDEDAETPCEPRPRVVPVEGPSEIGAPTPLTASAVTRYGMFLPFLTEELELPPDMESIEQTLQRLYAWSRGLSYEKLRGELGEGHYTDDDI